MNKRLAPQTTHNPIKLILNTVMMFANTACALEGFDGVLSISGGFVCLNNDQCSGLSKRCCCQISTNSLSKQDGVC